MSRSMPGGTWSTLPSTPVTSRTTSTTWSNDRFSGSGHVDRRTRAGRVEGGLLDDACDIARGDEVDRVPAAAEDARPSRRQERAPDDAEPEFLVGGRPDDRPRQPARLESGFGGGLHPEQLDRVVSRRAKDRDEHEVVDAGRHRGVDERSVRVAIDGPDAERSLTAKAVDRRDDGPRARHGPVDDGAVADVADDGLDARQRQLIRLPGAARDDAHLLAAVHEQRDERSPEEPGPARHEDHRVAAVPEAAAVAAPPTIWRTASLGPGPASSTGSM